MTRASEPFHGRSHGASGPRGGRPWPHGEAPSAPAALGPSARALGYHGLAWIPAGRDLAAGRRGIDPRLARSLAPGEVRAVGEADRRRAPQWSATAAEVLVAPRTPGTGVLLVRAPADGAVDPVLVSGWAELCARESAAVPVAPDAGRLAAATHDLRNQMTLALFELQRARAEAEGTGVSLTALERVLDAAREQCARALEQDGTGPDPTALTLRPLLHAAAAEAQVLARRSSSVRVRARCPEGLHVLGVRSSLIRLLQNLTSNAVEASSAGGSVELDARAGDDGRIALRVEDRGRGLSSEDVARLFARGRTRSATVGGTGYGTVSLLECLENLGAELELRTAPGEGTRAEVRLRAAPAGPTVVLVDALADRRADRAHAWRKERGEHVLECADPVTAGALVRALPREAELQAVVVARGTPGPGLGALLTAATRRGAHVVAWRAGDALPHTPRDTQPAPRPLQS